MNLLLIYTSRLLSFGRCCFTGAKEGRCATILLSLPLTQTIVFLVTTGLAVTTVPVKVIVALAVIGAKVEVPA